MKTVLEDIKGKIARAVYRNEEHVRVCIVLRILQALGWDIWNPTEVNSEFPVLPNEDQTRIDVALFLTPHEPSVFIEVKALGKLEGVLTQVERQLRGYNRDNTAWFSIITDGQIWRFYHSQSGGEFAGKCFKILHLTEHNLDDLEQGFMGFLSRIAVETGNAGRDATTILQLTRKQRAMEEALPEARRRVLESPFPSLIDALIQVVAEARISISKDEAERFIREYGAQRPAPEPVRPGPTRTQQDTEPETRIPSNEREYPVHGDEIPMRWFDQAILSVLAGFGGRASAQDVNEKIKEMMRTEGKLTAYWTKREQGGVTRWAHRVAARRYALVQRGCLSDKAGRGIWELTERGRRESRSA
jgi:hypothetical protein